MKYVQPYGVNDANASYVDGQSLVKKGSGADWACSMSRMQIFTSSGTFTVPDGVVKIKATLTGGGAAGVRLTSTAGNPCGGGGAGATCIGAFDVKPGQNLSFTIGAGGASATSPSGGTSTFNDMTAGGGQPGIAVAGNTNAGGAGGVALGGLMNLNGGGAGHSFNETVASGNHVGGNGGASFWGGGGRGMGQGIRNYIVEGQAAGCWGAGGGGCLTPTYADGGSGVLVIEH